MGSVFSFINLIEQIQTIIESFVYLSTILGILLDILGFFHPIDK